MLIATGEAIFNAGGRASVQLGPTAYGVEWFVSLMASTTTSTTETNLNVYRQTETPSALIANSRKANGDFNDDEIRLRNLEKLVFVWTGGTPNALATINLEGEVLNAFQK